MASSSLTENIKGKEAIDEVEVIPLDQNVLQRHAAFFDKNKDGVIYPWETYQVAIFINFGLSQATCPGKFPSPLLPIEIKNIQLAKHGSDTGVYDKQARIGSLAEWRLLYKAGKDKDGFPQKETVQGVYDGSLFERLEAERKRTENEKNK